MDDQRTGAQPSSALALVRALPQPMKSLYALLFVVIVVGGVLLVTTGTAAGLAVAALVAVMTGVVLLADVRGNATALTELIRTHRWMGMDLSTSPMASRRYPRLLGAGVVVVGAVLGVAALLDTTTT